MAGALETILQHERNARIDLSDALKNTIGVLDNVIGGVIAETCGGTETGEVVRSLVDRSQSPGSQVAALNNKVKDSLDELVRVGEVGFIVEPASKG